MAARSGTVAVVIGAFLPPVPSMGRAQITGGRMLAAPTNAFAALWRDRWRALASVPALSYAPVASGTRKVRPLTRRPRTMVLVFHVTTAPLAPLKAAAPDAPRAVGAVAARVFSSSPVSVSNRSTLVGKEIVEFRGMAAATGVKKVFSALLVLVMSVSLIVAASKWKLEYPGAPENPFHTTVNRAVTMW